MKLRIITLLLVTLGVFGCSSSFVSAADYRLPPINTSGAIQVSNWNELNTAVTNAGPGTTIIVNPGSYGDLYISNKNGNANGWIKIIGAPQSNGSRVQVGSFRFTDSSYIQLRNLKFYGTMKAANKAIEVIGGHHFQIWDNEITNGGEAGISFPGNNSGGNGGTDYIDIRYNDIHHNALHSNQGWWQGSGLSILFAQDRGTTPDSDGYKIRIIGNLLWDNYVDPVTSGGIAGSWGITDGNCIITDINTNYNYQGKTLIQDNICSDNGGPGVAFYKSKNVDILNNTFYKNVKTRDATVVNNGDLMCNQSENYTARNNIIVPRDDNPTLFRVWSYCNNQVLSGNVWVRTGYSSQVSDPSGIFLNNGAAVLANPQLNASAGNWTAINQAAGKGAQWPRQKYSDGTSPSPSPIINPSPSPVASPSPSPTNTSRSPYANQSIPGLIQMEYYDNGGPNVAYFDIDGINHGAEFFSDPEIRAAEGVDINKKTINGTDLFSIGWAEPGEWVEYTVEVAQEATYMLSAKVSNGNASEIQNSFYIEIDGQKVNFNSPQTGNWDTYVDSISTDSVTLTAGTHIMRLTIDKGSVDIDYIQFQKSQNTDPQNNPCPGDLNGDKIIDGSDYTLLSSAFLNSSFPAALDLNGDGVVDGGDYSFLANRFLTTCN